MSSAPENAGSPTRWLLVSSAENFEVSRARGFDIAGMKSRHRKKAETVRPGDTVLFYCVGIKAIAGLAEVTGTLAEYEQTLPPGEPVPHIWDSRKEGEEYPHRFSIKPVAMIAERDDFVPVEDYVDALEYPKRWPRANWTLAFQGNVHRLGEADYELLADAVRQAAGVAQHSGV